VGNKRKKIPFLAIRQFHAMQVLAPSSLLAADAAPRVFFYTNTGSSQKAKV
jgi:hypothetical protein